MTKTTKNNNFFKVEAKGQLDSDDRARISQLYCTLRFFRQPNVSVEQIAMQGLGKPGSITERRVNEVISDMERLRKLGYAELTEVGRYKLTEKAISGYGDPIWRMDAKPTLAFKTVGGIMSRANRSTRIAVGTRPDSKGLMKALMELYKEDKSKPRENQAKHL